MLVYSLRQLRKAKPVELLHSVSAGEREPKANWCWPWWALSFWEWATGSPSPSKIL